MKRAKIMWSDARPFLKFGPHRKTVFRTFYFRIGKYSSFFQLWMQGKLPCFLAADFCLFLVPKGVRKFGVHVEQNGQILFKLQGSYTILKSKFHDFP